MANKSPAMELDISDELIAERRAEQPGETPNDMLPWMRKVVAAIDITNNWVGKITCLLLIPIMAAMVYEVVARKLFVAPTLWAYDTSRMFYGAMFMLGAGYALLKGVHIRADFLYRTWSLRSQATVDVVLYLAFYFPAMLFFFWVSSEYTLNAWVRWERAMDTTLMAPLAPARTAMPVGIFFLILQGIAELLRCFNAMGSHRQTGFLRFMPVYILLLAAFFCVCILP